jgi:hypothetical protein
MKIALTTLRQITGPVSPHCVEEPLLQTVIIPFRTIKLYLKR